MRHVLALLLATSLAAPPGCAHYQPTQRQVGIAIIGASIAALLIILVVTQCNKGPRYCDNSNAPQ